MRAYNIYYKNEKINKKLLSKSEVDTIYKKSFIYKQKNNGKANDTIQIPVKDIKCYECIII